MCKDSRARTWYIIGFKKISVSNEVLGVL
jgi:hypothetical protein